MNRSIDTSTPEGAALLRWMYPESYTAPAPPVPGQYVELEWRSRRGTERHVVLITTVEQRDGYLYVGWHNAQPPEGRCHGRGWCPEAGQWGFFRQYPVEHEYGTSIIRVVA